MMTQEIVFLSGVRTPFGAFGGALKDLTATQLGVVAAKAALHKAGVDAQAIEHIIFGNVMQTSQDAIYVSRHIGLKAGCRIETPALTVNRLCGSGFEAIVQGARLLMLGEAQAVLVGGTESMSQVPMGGFKISPNPCLVDQMPDAYLSMGLTAENLADYYTQNEDGTFTPNFDLHPIGSPDGQITPNDLLEVLSQIGTGGLQERSLFDFSRFWEAPAGP
ncbi:MAG: hypothetical protein HUU16_01540 [Candidatus Omnitrophica bacterium]|nr:hypothetical protein [Candidatus Omnitrophota bacterium]